MDNYRRPSVGIPGIPGVMGGSNNPPSRNPPIGIPGIAGGNPAIGIPGIAGGAPSAAAAPPPARDAAKINMLRRMRAPPFQYAWTLYHDKHLEGESYDHRQTVLLENIITIKVFWEVYNSLPLRALALRDSVHFFKRGVRPVWEDRRNVTGGSWTFRVPKDKSEQTWKEVLMLAVGEQFADVIQPRDDLCGLTLSTRFNSDLIQIWTRDGNNQKTIDGVLKTVLEKLSPELQPKEGSYYYKKHSEHAGFAEAVKKANIKIPVRYQPTAAGTEASGEDAAPAATAATTEGSAAAEGADDDRIQEAEVRPDEAEAQQQIEDEEIIAKTPGLKEKFGF